LKIEIVEITISITLNRHKVGVAIPHDWIISTPEGILFTTQLWATDIRHALVNG